MKIAYGKMGRSIPLTLEDASSIGGDIEVVRLMNILRKDHEVHLVGRNRANVELDNVVNHWRAGSTLSKVPSMPYASMEPDNPVYKEFVNVLQQGTAELPQFDAFVLWLGQHGTSCSFIPAVKAARNDTVRPLMSSINYAYPLVHMINQLGVRPIWLCPDPRNLLKLRDIWNPNQREGLAQYKTTRETSFYDARDGQLRWFNCKYRYSGIEMLAVNPDNVVMNPPEGRSLFGLLVNEGPPQVKRNRRDLVKSWLSNLGFDWEMYGHWTDVSQEAIGRVVKPVDVKLVNHTLRQWKSTITFPASNTGWATAKPWECFLNGTICFKHPDYDDQNHIYGDKMPEQLRSFVRLITSTSLPRRLEELKDDATYIKYRDMQLEYFHRTFAETNGGAAEVMKEIERVAQEGRPA